VPRKPVVFFLDRSLGKRHVAEALREIGVQVEVHDDHFPPDTEDSRWIAEVSGRGWAIVTKDRRIRYRPLERAAVVAAQARLFALTSGSVSGPEMARILVRHLRRMERIVVGEPPPFIARVSKSKVSVERLPR
jgi:predicted nuclease of predicted toxin-antitoxin system